MERSTHSLPQSCPYSRETPRLRQLKTPDRMLKMPASGVLASFRPSTGTRPPHHSAARTNVVLLIRRTVRPRGYASGLHSLRPCWTAILSIPQEASTVVQYLPTVEFSRAHRVFPQPASMWIETRLTSIGPAAALPLPAVVRSSRFRS